MLRCSAGSAPVGLAAALLVASCFRPSYEDGQYRCPELVCPGSLTCTGPPDFLCVGDGFVAPDLGRDARPSTDVADAAGGPDAGPDSGTDLVGPPPDPGPDAGADVALPDVPVKPDQDPDACPPGGCVVALSIGHNSDDDVNALVEVELDATTPDAIDTEHVSLEVQGINSTTGDVEQRTALLRADLTGLGATVLEATLRLFVENEEDAVRVHDVLQDWTAESTYNEAMPEVPWTSPGCAGSPPLPEPPCRVDPEFFFGSLGPVDTFVEIPLPVELVQRWIDDPSTNRGVLFRIDPKDGAAGGLSFTGSAGTDGNRPRLLLKLAL